MISFKHSPFKVIFLIYVSVMFLFSFLFYMPFSNDKPISFIDALFLSSSAISGTGLSSINIIDSLSTIGTALLLSEIQIGGIGVMAIYASLFLFFRSNISISQQTLMAFDQNQNTLFSIKKLMVFILLYAFIVEFFGLIIYYFVFLNLGIEQPFYKSLFHSISSFANAGFDLFGDSMISFSSNHLILFVTAFQIILGSIGFPVIYELFFMRKNKLSLFTKTNLVVHFCLLVCGLVVFIITEYQFTYSPFSFLEKMSNAWFLSASSRNAGFTSVDLSQISNATVIFVILLMFIGGSASSAGGGIRTSTFAVLVSRMISYFRGNEETVLFKTTIHEDDVRKSFIIFMSFSILFSFSVFLISIFDPFSIRDISFEVMSALSATGLSTGITSQLSVASKIILSILMIIARIGIFAFIYTFIKPKKRVVKYPTEHIIVG